MSDGRRFFLFGRASGKITQRVKDSSPRRRRSLWRRKTENLILLAPTLPPRFVVVVAYA